MTFLLTPAPPVQMQARGFAQELPTTLDGLGAAFQSTAITTDSNFTARRNDNAVLSEYARSIYLDMGRDNAIAYLNSRGYTLDPASPGSDSIVWVPRAQQELLNFARKTPDKWGFDVSEEGIRAEQTRRLQAELQDAQDTLALLPPGQRAFAEIVGSMAGATFDIRNALVAPFSAVGSGGRLLTVAGREAALNVMAEAATMPGTFRMAERLGLPDPDVTQQLTIAAAAGGILGGTLEAGSRGLTYFFGTRAPASAPQAASAQMLVDEAEAALATRPEPFKDIVEAVRATPVEPERPPLIAAPEPVAAAPVVGDEANRISAAMEQQREDVLREYPWLRLRFPLARQIAAKGGIATRNLDGSTSWAYAELRNRGIDIRKMPWLFNNKRGSRDLDNLDFGDPSVMDWIGRDGTGNYADRDRLIALLSDEFAGKPSALTAAAEDAMRQARVLEADVGQQIDAASTPSQDFLAGRSEPTGLFIDREMYDFAHEFNAPEAIRSDVNRWIDENGFGDKLSPTERSEILAEAETRGGDVEYLVERALEREIDLEDEWWRSRQGAEATRAGQGSGAEGIPFDQADVERLAAGSPGGATGRASERTAAGEQTLVDGVAPIRPVDRLEARQRQAMTGRMKELDDGLFDLSAREQMDWLSEPSGVKARPTLDQQAADLRDLVTAGDDPVVTMLDGRQMRLSAALDDLDAGDEFADIIALCGRKDPTP